MIVGIAGRIASGKSTLARALAGRYSFKLISFGNYVRQEAQARGLDVSDRQVLQDFGQSLVDESATSFVHGVFHRAHYQPTDRVVLDGVRHESVWDEIVAFGSSHRSPVALIFLEMAEEERRRRLTARGLSLDEALAQDRHKSESDVDARLSSKADIHIDGLQDQESMLSSIGVRLGLD
jgi:dephospho-CoA kinase